jgi:hypothetical protein
VWLDGVQTSFDVSVCYASWGRQCKGRSKGGRNERMLGGCVVGLDCLDVSFIVGENDVNVDEDGERDSETRVQ